MSKGEVPERFEWTSTWATGGLCQRHLWDYRIPKSRYQVRAPVARIWENSDGTWSGTESKFSFAEEDIMPFETQEEAEATTIAIYLLKDRNELK